MSIDIGEPRDFAPGDSFRHFHYVIDGFLGAGDAGQVYAVHHRFTGIRFALKAIHLADRADAKRVARSLHEAQVAYSIQHDNVIRVVDLGCEEDGLVWLLMELLDGYALDLILARSGRLSPIYAIDIALECVWGLQAAHELGIIHRDVRPSNVFVTHAGRVKVIDFSLAKQLVGSPLKTTHGRPAKGTTGYMAPEHIRGAEPTAQFDVYALGIMLWQMLVGRHPFAESLGNPIRIVQQHLMAEPGSLVTAAGLPGYCDDVIRGATAKDAAARYAGMWPFGQALIALRERLLADRDLRERVSFTPEWERRLPIARGTGGALRYGPPQLQAPARAAPPVPSARVYVAPQVAATIPMEAVTESPVTAGAEPGRPGVNLTPLAVAAPLTVRRPRSPSWARLAWAALLAPAAFAVGVGFWLLGEPTVTRAVGSGPSAAPPPSIAPPRAPAPSASAPPVAPPRASVTLPEPRRLPRSRPGR